MRMSLIIIDDLHDPFMIFANFFQHLGQYKTVIQLLFILTNIQNMFNFINEYRSITKVISLRNISSFFTFLLYINGLCFTMHVINFSWHFISINHINV